MRWKSSSARASSSTLKLLAEEGLPVPDPSSIEVDAIAVEDVA
jgi:hypothetical protein